MLRILFGALLLFVPGAFACDGQTGKVIFEDKFTDDSGGWRFDESFVLKAPGATLTVAAADRARVRAPLNQTFTATRGDFCVEMSFPADAAQSDAAIGVTFMATDDENFWAAEVHADGKAQLWKETNSKWSRVWEALTNNLVKTGPTDVNSVRAVAKNGTITVIVNGQPVKSVRAQIPSGDLKFGFYAEQNKPSATPVSFTVRSYKVDRRGMRPNRRAAVMEAAWLHGPPKAGEAPPGRSPDRADDSAHRSQCRWGLPAPKPRLAH